MRCLIHSKCSVISSIMGDIYFSNNSPRTVHVVPASPLSCSFPSLCCSHLRFLISWYHVETAYSELSSISPFCQGLPKWAQVSSCISIIKDLPLVLLVQTAQFLAFKTGPHFSTFVSLVWTPYHLGTLISSLSSIDPSLQSHVCLRRSFHDSPSQGSAQMLSF